MAAGVRFDADGISLADMALPKPMYQGFTAQAGRIDRLVAHRRTLVDDGQDPRRDRRRRRPALGQQAAAGRPIGRSSIRGVGMARDILAAAGATHVFQSRHFAAHPGGSVRIGDGVDSDLQAGAANLFVCDASVIPQAWGLPPTLTLLCLGTRLGEHLAAR